MLINTEAFVLKSRKYNEADSLMVLFSRKLGKISAVAKGSRRAKSQMLAGIQPFCHSSFVLYQGRSLYTVNQVEARRIFYPLREDYRKLTYASYLVELVEMEITEGQSHPRLYILFGKALTLLSREKIELETLIRAFELHFMKVCGYEPQLFRCTGCKIQESGKWWFSQSLGGVLCPACCHQANDARPISATCLKLARYLLAKDINETVLLKIHPRLNEELQQLTKSYLLFHMERYQFRSLNLLTRYSEPTPMKPKMPAQQEFNCRDEAVLVQEKDSALTDAAEFDTFNETESSENSHDQEE